MAGRYPPGQPGQPLSFKTIPNRNKTQKWAQAKTYNYDGDDWGGYDPYDDYDDDAQSSSTAAQTQPPIPAPSQPYQARPMRQNSFDQGDERRAFSGPHAAGIDEYGGRQQRNFTNPEQVPPPLNPRSSPARDPASSTAAFPPRKSSMSEKSVSPVAEKAAPATDKPLPFIRPSDIYKRMAEEKEKEMQRETSLESAARPSLEGLAPVRSRDGSSLEPVREGHEGRESAPEQMGGQSTYQPLPSLQSHGSEGFGEPKKDTSPQLPEVSRFSGFGSDFLHGRSTSEESSAASQLPAPQNHVQDTIARVMGAPVVTTPGVETAAFNAQSPIDLQHQPSTASAGFRSVVNTAFDRQSDSSSIPATPVSRDSSHSQGGVSRSESTSTAGISPIMSRVPAAQNFPTSPIPEEPTPTNSRPSSGNYPPAPTSSSPSRIHHKPSPAHSRNASGEGVVTPGYRRSLEARQTENSPARTPVLEAADSNRRLSAPMTAERDSVALDNIPTATGDEAPDVDPSAPEVPDPILHSAAETPAGEIPVAGDGEEEEIEHVNIPTAIAASQRAQAADFGTREADLAREVSGQSSPDKPGTYSPPIAEAESNAQQRFLRTHNAPSSPLAGSGGFARPVSPGIAARAGSQYSGTGSGRASPALSGNGGPLPGRVRQIAENYNEINDASRRNSTASVGSSKSSSWSQFRGSDENLPAMGGLKKRGTGESGSLLASPVATEEDLDAGHRDITPRQADYTSSGTAERPHLPGEWVSYASTPGVEEPVGKPLPSPIRVMEPDSSMVRSAASPRTPRASELAHQEEEEPVDLTPTTRKTRLKAGDVTPDTEDDQPASMLKGVKDAGAALGASLLGTAGLASQARDFASSEPAEPVRQPELEEKRGYGDVSGYLRPQLPREESEASAATDVEGSVASAASSVPPTPPAKDTPGKPSNLIQQRLQAEGRELGPGGRPVSNYFSDAVAPLRTGHSREGSRTAEDTAVQQRQGIAQTPMSTATAAEDFESDRLRKEIVRSLDAGRREDFQRESILEDAERAEDALRGPEIARRVEEGERAKTPVEGEGRPTRLLDQRFSWEQRTPERSNGGSEAGATGLLASPPRPSVPRIKTPEPEALPEILPEEPYERPRSRNLHVMNADSDEEGDSPVVQRSLDPNTVERRSEDGEGRLREIEPSPVDEDEREMVGRDSVSARLPSYYQSDLPDRSIAPQESPLPSPVAAVPDAADKPVSPTPPPASASAPLATDAAPATPKLQSFRDILAIKNSADRIAAYDSTRSLFAERDTGLKDWMSNMLAQHPEHANLSTSGPTGAPITQIRSSGTFRHGRGPSIMKIGKGLSLGGGGGGEGEGSSGLGGSGGVEMEKVQQKGKELMKSATVLGGKASSGAKGLFAKGKSRWGRKGGDEKAPPKSSTPTTSSRLRPSQAPPTPSPKHSPAPTPPPPRPATRSTTSRRASPSPAPTPPPTSSPAIARSTTTTATPSPHPLPRPATLQKRPSNSPAQTPPPLTQRPTPSRASSSNNTRLSQAFERLRSGSRSRATSTTREKSKSRPGSLVLSRGSYVVNPVRPTELVIGKEDEEWLRSTAAAAAVKGGWGDVGRRKEVWEEGGQAVEREGTPGRLGVLPSPRLDGGFGSMSERGGILGVGEVVGGEESGARSGGGGEEAGEGDEVEVAVAPSSSLGYRIVNPETAVDQRRPSSEGEVEAPAHGVDDSEEQTADVAVPTQALPAAERDAAAETDTLQGQERPAHRRKVSALASLPSQQRTRLPSVPVITPLTNTLSDKPLYENTSMPGNVPEQWRLRDASGPPATSEQTDDPITRQPDEMSEVSAEDVTDAQETHENPRGTDETASRRSSLSSIGSPDTEVGRRASRLLEDRINKSRHASVDELVTKSQTPTGEAVKDPIPMPSLPGREVDATVGAQQADPSLPETVQVSVRRPSSQPQDFMNRSYKGRMAPPERAMSYAPLGYDDSGTPKQEHVTAVTGVNDAQLEAQVMREESASWRNPQVQQPPAYRQSSVSEYEKLRREQASDIAPSRSIHARQGSRDGPERTSRRFSGFFRGSNPTSPTIEPMPMPYAPPPHAIGPDFGLENLDPLGPDAVLNQSRDDLIGEPNRQEKRRSGIWPSMKRSPSVSRANASRTFSMSNTSAKPPSEGGAFTAPPRAATEGLEQIWTLKKPQRSATTRSPPSEEPKKKRFSSLGSIFRRSGTQGRGSPKPNKLQKSQPSVSGTRRVSAPIGGQTSYEAFEVMRQQAEPDMQGWQNASRNPQQYSQPRLPDATAKFAATPLQVSGQPSPQGWYGPGGDTRKIENLDQSGQRQRQQQASSLPSPPDPQQSYRQLHSEAWRRGMQGANNSEALRPVEMLYGGRPGPIGPAPDDRPKATSPLPTLNRQPTLPTQQPLWRANVGRGPLDIPRQRQSSAGTAAIAYSQRSPPKHTIPVEEDSGHGPMYYDEPQEYSSNDGGEYYEVQGQAQRARNFSAPSAQFRPETSRSPPVQHGHYPSRRHNHNYSYPSSPISPPPGTSTHAQARPGAQAYGMYEAGPRHASMPLPQQPQRQRYYAQAQDIPGREREQPLTYQRTNSGCTGRRDDADGG